MCLGAKVSGYLKNPLVRSERRSLSSGKLLDLDLPAVMARLISYEWEGCG